MSDGSFSDFITSERDRLHAEREAIFNQQHELAGKLSDINRELEAIDAYELAKAGKPARSGTPRGSGQTRTRITTRTRKGSKRDALLKVIQESEGLTRGEILDRMGLKGDKSGEMSVSNALTALTKGNQVMRRDGRYVAA